MNQKWIIIVAIIGIIVLIGGYFGWQQLQPTGDPIVAGTTAPAVSQTAVIQTGAEGMVVPIQHANVAMEGSGTAVSIYIEEGQAVMMGEPLLQLDTTDAEIVVTQAETAVFQAQTTLAAAEIDVTIAQLGLDGARLDVRTAEAELALLEAGATAEQLALAEQQTAVAEAAVTQAAGGRTLALEGANDGQVAAAQAGVTAAQVAYDNALRTHQPIAQSEDADAGEREQARLALAAAATNLAAAQAALDAVNDGATAFEQTAANSAVNAAVSQQDAAVAQYDLLAQGNRAEQIAIARAVLAQKGDGIAEAEVGVLNAATAVLQAETAVAEAQAGLDSAQNLLAKRTLVAPFAGTVMGLNVKAGEYVQAGVPVVVLADLSAWQVETIDFSELNITTAAVGDPVLVTIDAFAGQEWDGRIAAIADTPTVVRGDVNYAVTIDLDSVDAALRWGMTAYVELK